MNILEIAKKIRALEQIKHEIDSGLKTLNEQLLDRRKSGFDRRKEGFDRRTMRGE